MTALQENNSLCKHFLEEDIKIITEMTGSNYPADYELKFDSDWNWLMVVVERIENTILAPTNYSFMK